MSVIRKDLRTARFARRHRSKLRTLLPGRGFGVALIGRGRLLVRGLGRVRELVGVAEECSKVAHALPGDEALVVGHGLGRVRELVVVVVVVVVMVVNSSWSSWSSWSW